MKHKCHETTQWCYCPFVKWKKLNLKEIQRRLKAKKTKPEVSLFAERAASSKRFQKNWSKHGGVAPWKRKAQQCDTHVHHRKQMERNFQWTRRRQRQITPCQPARSGGGGEWSGPKQAVGGVWYTVVWWGGVGCLLNGTETSENERKDEFSITLIWSLCFSAAA